MSGANGGQEAMGGLEMFTKVLQTALLFLVYKMG